MEKNHIAYFPRGLFGDRGESLVRRVESDLSALHEGPLFGKAAEPPLRVYRFTWIRAFHPAIVVCLAFGPYLPARLSIKKLTRDHMFPAFPSTDRVEKEVSDDEVEAIVQTFRSSGFREAPCSDQKQGVSLDGAMWIIEAVEPDFYHAIYRHSPSSGPARIVGEAFLNLAGLTGEEIY